MLGAMAQVDRGVRRAQSATARGLAMAGLFAAAAAIVAGTGGGRWEVVHLAVAGGGSLVVSASALHLALTWSGAAAPPAWASEGQRWLLAVGVATVVVARPAGADGWVLVGAIVAAAGFVGLAALLAAAAAAARQDRYVVQTWAYVLAAAWAAVGAVLGGLLATGRSAAALWQVHPIATMWGFIGTVIVATLPTFAATTLRMKPSPRFARQRLGTALVAFTTGVLLAVVGGLAGENALAAVGMGIAALGLGVSWAMMPSPTRRAFDYAGPRGIGIAAGALWWVAVTLWVAVRVADGTWPTARSEVLVLLVGGLAQMLWAGICYFAPVLRGGGPERLSAGFAVMRSWVSLVALNAAAILLAFDLGPLAAALVALALLDTLWRVARLTRPAPLPE